MDGAHRKKVSIPMNNLQTAPAFQTEHTYGNGNGSVVDVHLKALYYSQFKAVRDTNLSIAKNTVTAFIGPSGCGKSTVLRSVFAARTSTPRPSTRCPCGGTSAWSSSNPIRSP
jgi:ABC-type glutathione transport system ATPase component